MESTAAVAAISAAAGTLATDLTGIAVLGIGVGLAVFGMIKAYRTFKRAAA